MGGEMANVKNSNLKVPPLKIVLSSATSGGSDRSSSTSPSSGSESLDSNLTIISEKEQHDKGTIKLEQKDDIIQSKQDKVSRNAARGSSNDKTSSNSTGNKRSQDNNSSEPGNCDPIATRDSTSSSSQRITRSSQRAAQQNKSENLIETMGDDTNTSEIQDKTIESARKVKRRKGEPQDSEQDNNQQVPPQPIVMANICPADYQLPSQNSFELYRDIRKRPYKKLLKLTHVQPRVPHGFKDYLLNSGPYLLDGNKIGVGLRGGASKDSSDILNVKTSRLPKRVPPKMKFSNLHNKFSSQLQQRKYDIPKILDVPKSLKSGSPLHELFQDQEKSRHKMRMQHLKERERSILAAEQEILRAYNKAAIVDSKQDLHLSACTYFYYQERYHYIDEKNDSIDCVNPKDLVQSQSNSDATQLINDETSQQLSKDTGFQTGLESKTSNSLNLPKDDTQIDSNKSDRSQYDADGETNPSSDKSSTKKKKRNSESQNNNDNRETSREVKDGPSVVGITNGSTCDNNSGGSLRSDAERVERGGITSESELAGEKERGETTETLVTDGICADKPVCSNEELPLAISDADLQIFNDTTFLNNLQEIDDKWTKIKSEMMTRHKNESDSLFAVQSLEWEWKAKEIGACDVRVSLKIDPDFVPRVEVSSLDY